MTDLAPLWALCSLNDDTLKESTPSDFPFEYVDISNVTEGDISDDLESLTFGTAPSRARRLAQPDDVIISTVRTYLRAIARVGAAESQRVYSTGFAVLRPVEGAVDPRYLAYILTSSSVMDEVIATSVGVSYPAIPGAALHRMRVPRADLDAQRAIADYLDRETGEIDAMIAKMDSLTDALRDRRAGVASSLFSRGYELVKLKWLMSEIDERAGLVDQDLPLLSVSIHHGVQFREESTSHQKASLDLGKYKVARIGQVALNRMRAFQGGLGRVFVDGLVSPDYTVLEANDRLSSVWAEYVMRTPEFIALMTQRLRGIGAADQGNVRTPRINVSDLVELSVPLPSRKEQEHLILELDEVTGKIDAMLTKVAELKSLLIERRAALITDVVTGRRAVA